MTTESQYPPVEIPDVDLWRFLFERETPFPEDTGTPSLIPSSIRGLTDARIAQLSSSTPKPLDSIPTAMSRTPQSHLGMHCAHNGTGRREM